MVDDTLLAKAYRFLIYDELEEYEEAITFLTDQLKARPRDPVLLNNRGIAYAETGRLSEALVDLTAAVQFASADDETPNENLSEVQRKLAGNSDQ